MPVETAEYINQLNVAYPAGGDQRSFGDDHIKLIKGALKRSFPNIGGAVTKTHTQLNNTPHDKSSLIQMVGQKLVTSEGFNGADTPAHEIALGYHSQSGRLRAKVDTNVFTPALAYLSDLTNATMPDADTISLGNKIVIKRYLFKFFGAGDFSVTFTPELAEIPFFVYVDTFVGYDGWQYFSQFQGSEWSVGGTLFLRNRSKTGLDLTQSQSNAVGNARGFALVIGKLP